VFGAFAGAGGCRDVNGGLHDMLHCTLNDLQLGGEPMARAIGKIFGARSSLKIFLIIPPAS
jgi:hypothetical protein